MNLFFYNVRRCPWYTEGELLRTNAPEITDVLGLEMEGVGLVAHFDWEGPETCTFTLEIRGWEHLSDALVALLRSFRLGPTQVRGPTVAEIEAALLAIGANDIHPSPQK